MTTQLKTVCVDARMLNNSGIGIYIRHFIKVLLANSHYSVVLLGRHRELSVYFSSASYRHIEADFPIYSITEQIKLPYLIPDCDVFWSPHYNIPALPTRARKYLVMVPDVYHLAFYNTLSTAQKLYAKTFINLAVRKANEILTISRYSEAEILKFTNIKRTNIHVIYLGIDNGLFTRIDDLSIRKSTRDRYNVPEKYVLFVGNVKPNKNLKSLVAAFILLLESLPNHHLLIVGKKEGFITGDSELFTLIDEHEVLRERVVFTGYVEFSDLPVLYSMASVFAFPSLYEGFGFPPLEAMACGCPVVASNRASIPEICGKAALYVDPLDSTSFASALYQMITDNALRTSIVQEGYRQAAKYDWNRAGEEFIHTVNSLID
ncbi:glycosyltransferase family 4 protein [Fibrella arboris]|uniref:glycosyltransferase family 4 protein n=1 Tax=Fibrella arboris TaxID=3242486 RepID=UPI0035225933